MVELGALALDAALGWPEWLHSRTGHPVGGFARIMAACKSRWNQPHFGNRRRRLGGVATLLLLIVVAALSGALLDLVIGQLPAPWSGAAFALAAWPALAQRSLFDHVLPIVKALDADDLATARDAVARIVGRDTAALDEAGVARGAIESLAESFCDGIVAPLFWLLIAGLPGIWVYKAVNTADSLIGHREEPFAAFGWASARVDDVMNFIPARLSALLICIAGMGGWRVVRRDHARHASPNAGWPEAAMAGALRVRLAGPAHYDGKHHDKAWIGGGGEANPAAARAALTIYLRACLLLWLLVAVTGGLGL